MKRSPMMAVLLVLTFAAAGFAIAGEKATISGEVIDSACYIKMGAHGADHAKCAEGCAKSGVPLALLTDDGKVVWLSAGKDMKNVNDLLLPYAAKKVTLEGEWFERGGTKLFSITKVEEAKS